jgi:predicted transcriptional regulator
MSSKSSQFKARVAAVRLLAEKLSVSQCAIAAACGCQQSAVSNLFHHALGSDNLLSRIESFVAQIAAERVITVGATITSGESTGSGMLPAFLSALSASATQTKQRIAEEEASA